MELGLSARMQTGDRYEHYINNKANKGGMMDKSRQQFEEFIKFHLDDAEINNKFETANNGLNYADQYVDLMWISWEASRESLEK